jgi:hypothetical protein
MLKEADLASSPYGIPARLKEKVGGLLPGGDGDD